MIREPGHGSNFKPADPDTARDVFRTWAAIDPTLRAAAMGMIPRREYVLVDACAALARPDPLAAFPGR